MTNEEKEVIVFGENTDRKLSLAYKHNPTIDNYLKLRRENTNIEFEIAITNGLEWLLANEDLLRTHGIDPEWFASSLDNDQI